MDNLKEIVDLLPEDSCRELKVFIKRQKNKAERKDLDLFNLMREENFVKPKEYIERLYSTPNANAYHALRKRLFKHIISFLFLKRIEEDNTSASMVMGMLSLSRYLFNEEKLRLAWHYLEKSEELAIQNEQYDLLSNIYNLQVEYSDSEYAPALSKILGNRKRYQQLADMEERAALASSLIKQRLKEVRLKSKQLDFDKIISDTLDQFELKESLYQQPKYLYNILAITRSAMLAKKDFYSFEPYIIKHYEQLTRKRVFNRANHFYKLSILYMLCHVLYRNRKFMQALEYLTLFKKGTYEFNRVYLRKFHVRYIMLLAAVKSYLGHSNESITLLEKLLNEKISLEEEDRLKILLNLGLYYFQQGDLRNANHVSIRFGHTDNWCAKKMGREWLMKKNLMELIIQYELGNADIVHTRLATFNKNFRDLYDNPIYNRVQRYTKFIRTLIDDPNCLSDKAFMQETTSILTQVPEEQEDLQAMTFYSWLKAKFQKRNFYVVLLETVR
ncbi:hypothetical protein QQ008_00295 [Fulvivirgaceae bacterium BMA10]|uniref:Tetratricopeptide repeat protein n=1 Tax=Splendidivirga corallicola TaxID=3051826 RepID=A0ABT8KGC8_9BACT|nr:hypothetical protein [Fulvivirgaceae bacterium BMA10]